MRDRTRASCVPGDESRIIRVDYKKRRSGWYSPERLTITAPTLSGGSRLTSRHIVASLCVNRLLAEAQGSCCSNYSGQEPGAGMDRAPKALC